MRGCPFSLRDLLESQRTVCVIIAGRSEGPVVKCEEVQANGEQRWKLTDVIGEEDGLGIECLSGSGAIAR